MLQPYSLEDGTPNRFRNASYYKMGEGGDMMSKHAQDNGFLSVPEVVVTGSGPPSPCVTESTAETEISEKSPPLQKRNRYVYGKREKLHRRRIVQKSGTLNVAVANVDNHTRQYIADFFTTLIDLKWRWTIGIFAMGFLISWLSFAVIWWLICYAHGDFDHFGDADWTPCVREQMSFASSFLFSLETQHTIGYGSRHITEECPEAILTLIMQSITGVLIQCFVVGMVFSKVSRPKKRAQTLMFSRNAVICKRDNKLCLLFRVGDMRRSQILEAHVRVIVVKKKVTEEGEVIPLHRYDLNVGFDTGLDRIFMIWPVTVTHVIDEDSPFYEMTADDFENQKFEIVVVLEGIIESTGMTTQARSSYLNGEVLWGYRFQRLVTFQREDGLYRIDYSRFHNTIPVETPNLSAQQLDELKARGRRSGLSPLAPVNLSGSRVLLFDPDDTELITPGSDRRRSEDDEDDLDEIRVHNNNDFNAAGDAMRHFNVLTDMR